MADAQSKNSSSSGSRFVRSLCLILLALLVAGFAYLAGSIRASTRLSTFNHAKYALKKTGLSSEYAPSFCLYGFTGFRDTFSVTQLLVENMNDRARLFRELSYEKGWHVESVSAEEFQLFADTAFWSYGDVIQFPNDISFDAWYYLQTSEPASFSPHSPEGGFFDHRSNRIRF